MHESSVNVIKWWHPMAGKPSQGKASIEHLCVSALDTFPRTWCLAPTCKKGQPPRA